MRNENILPNNLILQQLQNLFNIATKIKSGEYDSEASLVFLNSSSWKGYIEQARNKVIKFKQNSEEGNIILKLMDLYEVCQLSAHIQKNERIIELIIENIMRPLVNLSYKTLEDYGALLFYKRKYKEIIDQRHKIMEYANGNYIYPNQNFLYLKDDNYHKYEQQVKRNAIGAILKSYLSLLQISDGFNFYIEYIKVESTPNKKQYEDSLKRNILSLLESYKDQKEYTQFYQICYSSLSPPVVKHSPSSFVNSELLTDPQKLVINLMEKQGIPVDLLVMGGENKPNILIPNVHSTTTSSSDVLTSSNSSKVISPEALMEEARIDYRIMNYSQAYKKLQENAEILKEHYMHLFYIQELLCMLGCWLLEGGGCSNNPRGSVRKI